jgi:hypothetical protein
MAKKAYRVRNWEHYNKSLVQRGSLTFWFSEDIIKSWKTKEKENSHGNQKYSNMAILCCLTLRQLFRLPLRATEGLMGSLIKLINLPFHAPNYSTLSRRGKTLTVNLNIKSTEQARHVLVDSTGIQIIGEGEWKRLRHGESRHQLWRKLHIAMDASDYTILSAAVTESVRLDGNYLPGLIEQIPGTIAQITGDGAYDKEGCYQTAYEKNARAVFPPQHNACIQRNKYKKNPALKARDETILCIGRDSDRGERLKSWKKDNNYHRRSLVETMMFRMKTIFGDQIRSRTMDNQRTDLLVRCYAINKINLLGLPLSEAI